MSLARFALDLARRALDFRHFPCPSRLNRSGDVVVIYLFRHKTHDPTHRRCALGNLQTPYLAGGVPISFVAKMLLLPYPPNPKLLVKKTHPLSIQDIRPRGAHRTCQQHRHRTQQVFAEVVPDAAKARELEDGRLAELTGERGPQPRGEHGLKETTPVLCVDTCLLYTSDAADEEDSVDLGGRRIIKKKKSSI
eukprot:TRINITY_DN8193_c0_g1_i2.p2 TRINITY_DN8193_c0_g1~~TRINITY_DN8193_c0_g1_i2.p2  ORF type:complete len:193 (+),score=17.60 TRINITY_DN8193_c0_g1_i2:754-1332(+)